MTQKRMHTGIAISYIENMAQETGKGLARYFSDPMTEDEAQSYLDDLKAKGYEGIPSCDNVNDKGWCGGHPIES